MKLTLFMLVLGLVCWGFGGEQPQSKSSEQGATGRGVAGLSPEMRELLREEMRLLKGGLQNIGAALPQGEWTTIAKTAEHMRDSYIMKAKTTASQRQELHQSLGSAFIKKDIAFHETANKLVHAAHRQDVELSHFYFSKMVERCLGCHMDHATDRFPGLQNEADKGHDHH